MTNSIQYANIGPSVQPTHLEGVEYTPTRFDTSPAGLCELGTVGTIRTPFRRLP